MATRAGGEHTTRTTHSPSEKTHTNVKRPKSTGFLYGFDTEFREKSSWGLAHRAEFDMCRRGLMPVPNLTAAPQAGSGI